MPDSEKPKVIYHYTTIETMMKIVDSASIWATSINYLNDTSEGEHFQELVRKRIPRYCESHAVDDSTVFDVGETPDTNFISRPFVASFSEESDSLSQWRSYCPNGNGIAIGLRVECLERCTIEKNDGLQRMAQGAAGADRYSGVTLAHVDYVHESSHEVIDEAITSMVKRAKQLFEAFQESLSLAEYFSFILRREACSKKDKSFSSEREYRLIVDGIYSDNPIEFRTSRSTLIPYVPLSIPRKETGHEFDEVKHPEMSEEFWKLAYLYELGAGRHDFVDRVVIGPTPNMTLSAQAVESFFKKKALRVEVVRSAIPYRDW